MSRDHLFRKGPSEAQKSAGNYQKDHKRVLGMRVSIETPKNQFRSGTDKEGNKWRQQLHHDYGYIRGAYGKDKDHLDVFLGPEDPKDHPVHVIDQYDPHSGDFDEHKVMMGFPHPQAAVEAYHQNYERGWRGFGDVTSLNHGDFKRWAFAPGRRNKPIAEHSASSKALKAEDVPGYKAGGSVKGDVQAAASKALKQNIKLATAIKKAVPEFEDFWTKKQPLLEEGEAFKKKHPQATTKALENENTATVGCFLKYLDVPAGSPDNVTVDRSHEASDIPGYAGGGQVALDDVLGKAGPGVDLGQKPLGNMGVGGVDVGLGPNIATMPQPAPPMAQPTFTDPAMAAPGGNPQIPAASDPAIQPPAAPPAQSAGFTVGPPSHTPTPVIKAPAPEQPAPVAAPTAGSGGGGSAGTADADGPIRAAYEQYKSSGKPPYVDYNTFKAFPQMFSNHPAYDPNMYSGAGVKRGGHITKRRFADGGAAYIGYRGPRREFLNDREASANAPLYLGRGALTGIIGAPGESELFARWLLHMLGAPVSEDSLLPGTERVGEFLPGKPQMPSERAFQGLGELGGGTLSPASTAVRVARPIRALVPAFAGGGKVAGGLAGGLYNNDIGQGALQTASENQRIQAMAAAQAAAGGGGRMVPQGPDWGRVGGSIAGTIIGNALLPGVGGYIGGTLGGYAEDLFDGVGDFLSDIF